MAKLTLRNVDKAGGIIRNGASCHVTVDGLTVSLLNDPVDSHGDSPHRSARMVEASNFVTVDGIPVVFQGCIASCRHAATGSSHVDISE